MGLGCEAHDFSSGDVGAAARALGIDLGYQRSVPSHIEEAAKPVGRKVVCLCGTCPRRAVTECSCGWARRNQLTIQYALMDGKSEKDIVDAYVQTHGLKVLPHPPATAFGSLSWAVPFGGALMTLIVLAWYGARLKGEARPAPVPVPIRTQEPEEGTEARKRLERELAELED